MYYCSLLRTPSQILDFHRDVPKGFIYGTAKDIGQVGGKDQ